MNILIVTQYFWPENFKINDLAVALKEEGHQITVLTGKPNYPEGKIYQGFKKFSLDTQYWENILIKRVPIIPRGKNRLFNLLLNYLSFVCSACCFGLFACKEKYDLIFVYEPSPITVAIPAVFLKFFKKSKMFLWVQDLWPESLIAVGIKESSFLITCVRKLVRGIYKHADKILIQSEGFRSQVISAGALPEKVIFFPNWAEVFYYPVLKNPVLTAKLNLPSGFVVMFAGNIGAAQAFETILGAAEILKNQQSIHWIILGDGHKRTWVEKEIAAKQLVNVHLLGRKPAEQMPEYFAYADALLVTLKDDPVFALTIPSKVQTYLACGRPIIGALAGEGAAVISAAKAGLVSPPEDAAALARQIETLFQMPMAEREEMGASAYQYHQQCFERSTILKSLDQLLTDL